jgi:hypothetical protein
VLSPAHFKISDERVIRFLMEKTAEYNIKIRPAKKENAFFISSQAVRGVLFMTILSRPAEARQEIIDELIDMLTSYLEN